MCWMETLDFQSVVGVYTSLFLNNKKNNAYPDHPKSPNDFPNIIKALNTYITINKEFLHNTEHLKMNYTLNMMNKLIM